MSSEWEETLIRLQNYVPFLKRAKEYYISSPDENATVSELITLICKTDMKR